MKSGPVIIATAAILAITMIIATVINPQGFEMEATGLMLIAVFLGGIYCELKRLNDAQA